MSSAEPTAGEPEMGENFKGTEIYLQASADKNGEEFHDHVFLSKNFILWNARTLLLQSS